MEPFRPIIDGFEIKDQTLTLFKQGRWQSEKQIIIGTNIQEMALVNRAAQTRNISLSSELFKVMIIFSII